MNRETENEHLGFAPQIRTTKVGKSQLFVISAGSCGLVDHVISARKIDRMGQQMFRLDMQIVEYLKCGLFSIKCNLFRFISCSLMVSEMINAQ